MKTIKTNTKNDRTYIFMQEKRKEAVVLDVLAVGKQRRSY
jgi:hypothetical protein